MKSIIYRKCVVFMLAGMLAVSLIPISVWACNTGTVRDDAFTARRDQYRLCYFAKAGEVQDSDLAAMNQWISSQEERFNLSLEVVDVEQPDMLWERYGLPQAPEEMPATLLIGSTGISPRAFVLKEWQGIIGIDPVEAFLASPALDKAKETLVESWGVLLYSPALAGTDTGTRTLLEGFVETWSAEHPPGITLLEFDRSTVEEEMLAALIGPRDEQAWTAMLFGRCKLLAPPLLGEDITQDGLEQVLSQLTAPCTCVEQSKDMGLDLPVYWDKALDERFIALEEQAQSAGGYQEITFEEQVEELQADVPDDSKGFFIGTFALVTILFHVFLFTSIFIKYLQRRKKKALENIEVKEPEE